MAEEHMVLVIRPSADEVKQAWVYGPFDSGELADEFIASGVAPETLNPAYVTYVRRLHPVAVQNVQRFKIGPARY